MRPAALALVLAALPGPAMAHAVDEYIQHILVSVEADRIEISLRLVPGLMVLSPVLDIIDKDGDRRISRAETNAYGAMVARDLRLTLDGRTLTPKLQSTEVPQPGGLKDGFGAIRVTLTAPVLRAAGSHRLELENRHLAKFSAYLVNSLAPADAAIRIAGQRRNQDQSVYRLDYITAP